MPIHRKHSTIAERAQALTLHACGTKISDIEAITGIKKETFKSLLSRAKKRGYCPGGPVKDEHVQDAPRIGRPKVINETVSQTILDVVTQDRTTREYSTQELAEAVKERLQAAHPYVKPPSRRSILRWLRSQNFRSVKPTLKPGLTKANRVKRLAFAMRVRDWTLEDWKKLVWSDETSVVLGAMRGKRRIWRRPWEKNFHSCTWRRWKGFMTFMFWACFTWAKKGPCYCWPNETSAMTAKYKKMMDIYNEAHEEEDRENWELETKMRRMKLKGVGGRKPTWKYTAKTGKQERKGKSGGIDWMRYQQEVLIPRFIPFMEQLKQEFGAKHIVQEDNCSSHVSRWNRELWEKAGFEVLEWPANSPDLNAIEPPWARMKSLWKRKKIARSRPQLEKEWTKQWKDFPIQKLQRFVERIEGNIKWVIRLKGGNEYHEGTLPLPLEDGKEEPGDIFWREWLQKTQEERDVELAEDPEAAQAELTRGELMVLLSS